jgi:hypothetical protein
VLDDSLLDDPGRLAVADGEAGGCLRAAALAGAQVRATTEASSDAGIAHLSGTRPRALVLACRPGAAPAVGKLLVALLGAACPVPLVLGDSVPGWVGPLDVVLAHTDDPGDMVLAEAVNRAGRRGATVVLTAPSDGPVAAAAAGAARLLPARVAVPPGFAFARAFAAGLALLDAIGLLRTDLYALADELDKEAERDHAAYESFVNPAKSLALRIADRVPVLAGLDAPAAAVADHGADVLAGFAGVVASASDYPQFCARTVLHRASVAATSGSGHLFADPDDLAPGAALLRVLLLAVTEDNDAVAARMDAAAMLPGADLLAPAEETVGGPAIRAAVLALRFELAAVYLGLATGALGGPGRYAQVAV